MRFAIANEPFNSRFCFTLNAKLVCKDSMGCYHQ